LYTAVFHFTFEASLYKNPLLWNIEEDFSFFVRPGRKAQLPLRFLPFPSFRLASVLGRCSSDSCKLSAMLCTATASFTGLNRWKLPFFLFLNASINTTFDLQAHRYNHGTLTWTIICFSILVAASIIRTRRCISERYLKRYSERS